MQPLGVRMIEVARRLVRQQPLGSWTSARATAATLLLAARTAPPADASSVRQSTSDSTLRRASAPGAVPRTNQHGIMTFSRPRSSRSR